MQDPRPSGTDPITAVVVTYQSAHVIESGLVSIAAAAPRRGVTVRVVDNASTDGSAELARRFLGPESVIALPSNRGFAAGVNAVLEGFAGRWLAVLNPDLVCETGALDALVNVLERSPGAGLVGPRVRSVHGGYESSVGRFPSLERERTHALLLTRLLGREGRLTAFPGSTSPIDWVSGCAWMLRGEAVRRVGPLDETYFMYYEDVDYCRRLWNEGWEVLATPDAVVTCHFPSENAQRVTASPKRTRCITSCSTATRSK